MTGGCVTRRVSPPAAAAIAAPGAAAAKSRSAAVLAARGKSLRTRFVRSPVRGYPAPACAAPARGHQAGLQSGQDKIDRRDGSTRTVHGHAPVLVVAVAQGGGCPTRLTVRCPDPDRPEPATQPCGLPSCVWRPRGRQTRWPDHRPRSWRLRPGR